MNLLLNPQGQIAGMAHETYEPAEGWQKLPLPDGFVDEDWDFMVVADGVVTVDAAAKAAQELAGAKAALKGRATALRWQHETGGITLPGGIQIATGTGDQNRITTVIANAKLAGVTSVDFKAASGWVTLTIEQVEGIAAAIALHVQACFSTERKHHEDIDSASFEDLQSYSIGGGWPVSIEEQFNGLFAAAALIQF